MKFLAKAIFLIFIALYLSACEEQPKQAELASVDEGGKPDPTVTGYEEIVPMQDGDFVMGGSAHPVNGGDIIIVSGSNYVYLHWANGELVKEEGTVDYRQDLQIVEQPEDQADYHIYTNKMIFTPQSYTPSNCGYSFDSYEKDYSPRDNNGHQAFMFDIGQDWYQEAIGWPLDEAWADANLTPECL